jgi:hypothetical protein
MTKTHWEERKSYVHKSTCQEVMKDKAYIEDVDVPDSKNQQTFNRKSGVHESTCQKGMMNKTYQEEVKDEAYTENVDVPGAVANTSSGPDDPQNDCVTGQTGTKDDTKMLAVTAIASETEGGPEGITKCASTCGPSIFATLARQLPPASATAASSFD